jgi:protein gp37
MCDFLEEGHASVLTPARERLWGLILDTPNLIWLLLTKRAERIETIPRAILEARNVMIGISIEDQQRADERLPLLLQSFARATFLSCEPLLGPIELGLFGTMAKDWGRGYRPVAEGIHWVIVGGESQPGCRPMDLAWAAGLVGECKDAEVPVFVKQLGGHPDKRAHPETWPAELRIQQFPELAQTAKRPADPAPSLRSGASAGRQTAPGGEA